MVADPVPHDVWLTILHALLAIVPLVFAITLHETAHGYAALALGDTTAKDQGRLTLNPLAHIDRMGTIILPGILLITQLLFVGKVMFMFGWAKPVPVSAWKFPNPRRYMAIVTLAGPAMNFFLVWLSAFALGELADADMAPWLNTILFDFMLFNMVLGLFNLLPIPPLDGGRVVVGLLPENLARSWAGLERYGLLIVLGLILVLPNVFGVNPINDVLETVLPRAFRLAFWLAGYHG
jgi:Zn-dependent protease